MSVISWIKDKLGGDENTKVQTEQVKTSSSVFGTIGTFASKAADIGLDYLQKKLNKSAEKNDNYDTAYGDANIRPVVSYPTIPSVSNPINYTPPVNNEQAQKVSGDWLTNYLLAQGAVATPSSSMQDATASPVVVRSGNIEIAPLVIGAILLIILLWVFKR